MNFVLDQRIDLLRYSDNSLYGYWQAIDAVIDLVHTLAHWLYRLLVIQIVFCPSNVPVAKVPI